MKQETEERVETPRWGQRKQEGPSAPTTSPVLSWGPGQGPGVCRLPRSRLGFPSRAPTALDRKQRETAGLRALGCQTDLPFLLSAASSPNQAPSPLKPFFDFSWLKPATDTTTPVER